MNAHIIVSQKDKFEKKKEKVLREIEENYNKWLKDLKKKLKEDFRIDWDKITDRAF